MNRFEETAINKITLGITEQWENGNIEDDLTMEMLAIKFAVREFYKKLKLYNEYNEKAIIDISNNIFIPKE